VLVPEPAAEGARTPRGQTARQEPVQIRASDGPAYEHGAHVPQEDAARDAAQPAAAGALRGGGLCLRYGQVQAGQAGQEGRGPG